MIFNSTIISYSSDSLVGTLLLRYFYFSASNSAISTLPTALSIFNVEIRYKGLIFYSSLQNCELFDTLE